jgi:hypothetical protein
MFHQSAFRSPILASVVICCLTAAFAATYAPSDWRSATEKELQAIIPARAPVEKERIETEFRTASGVTDGHGKFIAGVVMITAGYSAEGKYSHYFLTQVPIEIGGAQLRAGEYVLGTHRADENFMDVTLFEASTGKQVVAVKAESRKGAIHQLVITPPERGNGTVRIGRFVFEYKLAQ